MPCPSQTSGFNVPNYVSWAIVEDAVTVQQLVIVALFFRLRGSSAYIQAAAPTANQGEQGTLPVSRLQWAGHVLRMTEHEITKKVMENKFEGRRGVGRSKLRWMDGVLEDLRRLRIKGWWLVAREEIILRDMLVEINDGCEQYEMKIKTNKTKTTVIGRKVKTVNLRILNEAVEQQGRDLSGEVLSYGSQTYFFDHTRTWRASPDEDQLNARATSDTTQTFKTLHIIHSHCERIKEGSPSMAGLSRARAQPKEKVGNGKIGAEDFDLEMIFRLKFEEWSLDQLVAIGQATQQLDKPRDPLGADGAGVAGSSQEEEDPPPDS
ncbi:hypothetical protein ANN_03417 [Periplaneta americana]|uniref:Uncharacterized protein n=1 Tax=Periplaneta americana TaxID=6978 RepID=A0ABQ8U1X1_PERAM|nr:hypothetical protein ANN_03417 [Periplaneta americana]